MNAVATAIATTSNLTIVSKVNQAINLMIESERKGLKNRRNTAIALNAHFRCEATDKKLTSGFAWFDVTNGDKSSDGKQVLEYKDSIIKALKDMKHSNPYKVWADVCFYGRDELDLPQPKKTVKPASEKLINALKTAHKIAVAHPSPSEAEVEAALSIQRILATLGADIAE